MFNKTAELSLRPIQGALKSFQSPRLLFPKFVMGFCSDRY